MHNFTYEIKDLEVMASANNYHDWIVSEFVDCLQGNVAEIGAGSGNFSSSLLQNKNIKKLLAVEPDKEACVLYKQNIPDLRAEVVNGFFPDIHKNYLNNFDAVVYVNVLEHVEKDRAELTCVYNSLKNNGKICIFVPALPFLYSDHDKSIGHFRRYTKKELRKTMEDAGFELKKIKYMDIVGIFTWFIVFKIFKMNPGTGNVSFYDKFITPVLRLIENIVPPPIGKSLLAIGKKV